MNALLPILVLIVVAIVVYLKMVKQPKEPPPVVPPVKPPFVPPVVPPIVAPPVVRPVRPPIVPPVIPPIAPPVVPPGETRPLADSFLEGVRQSYARDFRGRGGKWIAAEREFLRATNPGMPASLNIQTIEAKYREIFNRTVAAPVILPVVPPVRPPGTLVSMPFDEYRRLFPVLAAKIERIYREAGRPPPPHVKVHPGALSPEGPTILPIIAM